MTTWAGWAADFLAAASLPNTADNRRFLNEWAANADHPNCANNPIDLTHHEPGSSNCASTGQTGVNVQRYTDHTWARTAFNSEIHSGDYPHLLAALRSGNPYAVSKPGPVATDLGLWASTAFANIYLDAAATGGPATVRAPHALGGWHDVQRSFSRRLPVALREANRNNVRALQSLARARKVRL